MKNIQFSSDQNSSDQIYKSSDQNFEIFMFISIVEWSSNHASRDDTTLDIVVVGWG